MMSRSALIACSRLHSPTQEGRLMQALLAKHKLGESQLLLLSRSLACSPSAFAKIGRLHTCMFDDGTAT